MSCSTPVAFRSCLAATAASCWARCWRCARWGAYGLAFVDELSVVHLGLAPEDGADREFCTESILDVDVLDASVMPAVDSRTMTASHPLS